MKIGLVGKPNVGKSSFYQAATLAHAEVGNYPFTTIAPNLGVGFVRVPDPGHEKGFTPTPKSGFVRGNTRFVPIQIVDVAGLVPGAHEGRGLGNKFLTDAMQADVLLHIVDASGGTDEEGNTIPAGTRDPLLDVAFLETELHHWMSAIMGDGWEKTLRKAQMEGGKMELVLEDQFSGLGIRHAAILHALRETGLAAAKPNEWTPERRLEFCAELQAIAKPILVVFNKSELVSKEEIARLSKVPGAIFASAQSELALKKADAAGLLRYNPGDGTFEVTGTLNPAQSQAIEKIRTTVTNLGATGVQSALERAAFETAKLLPAFPVADEAKWTDKEGRTLPDCFLVPTGTTAHELAFMVHTDLGKNFVRAIDGRTKRALGKEHEVEAGQILCIRANT